MLRASGARRAKRQSPRFGLGQRDQFCHRVHSQTVAYDQQVIVVGDMVHRGKIAQRIVRQRWLHQGSEGQVAGPSEQQGVTIGWLLGDEAGAHGADRAGLIFDNDFLLQVLAHLRRDDARGHVCRAARRVRHDECDRSGRIRLSERRSAPEERQGNDGQTKAQANPVP